MSIYQARLGAIIPLRGQEEFFLPGGLQVGLLTVSPQPEGAGYVELSSDRGYARQPLLLNRNVLHARAGMICNQAEVPFNSISPEDPHVTDVGVFGRHRIRRRHHRAKHEGDRPRQS